MIEQDYIMLIMNCKKYIKKAKFQKITWLPRIPSYLKYIYIFLSDLILKLKGKF
jgi:hypothetical protein